jgi:hypothetical protein
MDDLGFYEGRHYTAYVDQVQILMRKAHLAEAERLLVALLDAVEAESEALETPVAPWYYRQLARIYRLQGDLEAEVSIIERHNRQRYALPQASFERRLTQVYEYASA